jgi:hypothetical protein
MATPSVVTDTDKFLELLSPKKKDEGDVQPEVAPQPAATTEPTTATPQADAGTKDFFETRQLTGGYSSPTPSELNAELFGAPSPHPELLKKAQEGLGPLPPDQKKNLLENTDEFLAKLEPKKRPGEGGTSEYSALEGSVMSRDPAIPLNTQEEYLLRSLDVEQRHKFIEAHPEIELPFDLHKSNYDYRNVKTEKGKSIWEDVKGVASGVGSFLQGTAEAAGAVGHDINQIMGGLLYEEDPVLALQTKNIVEGKPVPTKEELQKAGESISYGQNLAQTGTDVITAGDQLLSYPEKFKNLWQVHSAGGFNSLDKLREERGYQTPEQSYQNDLDRTTILREQARKQIYAPTAALRMGTDILTGAQELKEAGWVAPSNALQALYKTHLTETASEKMAKDPTLTEEQANAEVYKDAADLLKQRAEKIAPEFVAKGYTEAGKPEIRFAADIPTGAEFGVLGAGLGMVGKGIAGTERLLANAGRDPEAIAAANLKRLQAAEAEQKLVGQIPEKPGYVPVGMQTPALGQTPKPLFYFPRFGTLAGWGENTANAIEKFTGHAAVPLSLAGLGAATSGEGHRTAGFFEGLGLSLGLKGLAEGAGVVRSLDQAAELFGGKNALPSDVMKAAGAAETSSKAAKKLFGGDTFLKALGRDGADFIAKNAVPLALKNVHGATLAYAMGLLNDTPSEDMPEQVAFGTLMSAAPGLFGHSLGESHGEMRMRAGKEAAEVNNFNRGLDDQSRTNISASRLWMMHLAKLRKAVIRARNTAADSQAQTNNPSATPEQRARWSKIAADSQNIVDFHQRKLNQALTTNPATMAEFGRQFNLSAARMSNFLNGTNKAGQENVSFQFLTTDQIAEKLLQHSPELQMMIARGQGEEARQRALTSAQQRGFVSTPESGIRMDPARPTIAINVGNLMNNPRGVIETLYHEVGEAAQKIPQVKAVIDKAGVIDQLFSRTVKGVNGETLRTIPGLLDEGKLYQMFINKYVYGMSAPEILNLGREMGVLDEQRPDQLDFQKVVERMRSEVIADTLGEGFEKSFVNGSPAFENVRQWARTKVESERIKALILKVLGSGGEDPRNVLYSHPASGVGESLTPEVRAAVSQAIQSMRDLGGVTTAVDETGAVSGETREAPRMSKKEVSTNPLLSDRYLKNSGLVKTQLRAVILDADGNPVSKPIDITDPTAFEGTWQFKPDGTASRVNGFGNRPPELPPGVVVPPGGQIIFEHQIVTEPDGVTPVWNSRKDVKKLLKSRSQLIRDAITNAYKGEPGGMQAYSEDNLSFRGTLTPDQIAAIQALPESIVPLKVKNHIFEINNAIQRGQRQNIDYSTHVGKNGEYVSSAPTIRDVQWIGMHFSKDGNFTGTALSWDALHNKFRLWKQRLPGRFDLWNGDSQAMYDQFVGEYLPNQASGIPNETALDKDPEISKKKRDVFNDFLNFANANTRAINPDRTIIPTKRGEKRGMADNVLRSFRLDSIMDIADSPVPGVKLNPDAIYNNFLPKESVKPAKPAGEETNPILKALGAVKASYVGPEQRTPYAQPVRASNQDVQRISEEYVKSAGMEYRPHGQAVPVNEELAKRIADHYETAKNEPLKPEVKKAYTALANEVVDQWKAFQKAGYTATPWTGEGQPYANSAEMMKDVRDNKHLYYYTTESGFGSGITGKMRAENPMLQDSGVNFNGAENVPVNDVFRVVHDIVGHGANGYEFGPKGEFNAYLEHSRMFSDAAKPALAAETLAQNSWVNYGPHLRDESGNIAKKGEKGYVPVTERPFAEQKNIALPQEFIDAAEKQAQAGTKPGPSFLPAKGETKPVPTQEELDEMKARLPKYEVSSYDHQKNGITTIYLRSPEDKGIEPTAQAEVQMLPDDYPGILGINHTERKSEYPGFGEALYREIAKFAQQHDLTDLVGLTNKASTNRRETLFETSEKLPTGENTFSMTSKVAPGINYLPAKKLTVQHPSKEKEGSVGGELDLVHFGPSGLKVTDPKKFGKGIATPTDLQGGYKTYFYLNNGKNYEASMRGKTPYVAKVDGNSLYDLSKDPLGVNGILNREERDDRIKKAGFAGYFSPKKFNGSFDAVALYKPTKLTEVQQGREIFTGPKQSKEFGVSFLPAGKTSSPEFKKWFGESQVVDEEGKPRVMYHGTDRGFNKFQKGTTFFAFKPEFADEFANRAALGWQAESEEAYDPNKSIEDYKDDLEMEPDQKQTPVIVPVYLQAKNIFDANNPDHMRKIGLPPGTITDFSHLEKNQPRMEKAGFDSYYDYEYGPEEDKTGIFVFDPKQVKSATGNVGTYSPENADIRYLPAKLDEAHAKAIESGDTEEAQRLVDEAAKKAGYSIGPVYHHGHFDPSYDAVPKTQQGMHFGSEEAARQRAYDKQPDDERASIKADKDPDTGLWHWSTNSFDSFDFTDGFSSEKAAIQNAYDSIAEMHMNQDSEVDDLGVMTKAYLSLKNLKKVRDQGNDWQVAMQKAKQEGYDGLEYKNEFEDKGSTSYVIFNPEQVKSADPATYDDQGNLIPLSQRFNPESNDIRYLPAKKGVDEGTQTNESLPTDEQQTESNTEAKAAGIQAGGQSQEDRNRLLGGLASVARGAQGSGAESVPGTSGTAPRKEVEEAALRKHAEENGLMRDPDAFFKQWQLDGSEAGGEHQVSFPLGDNVVKRTPNPYYPTWADYFDSLQIHNTLFPKAALTFRGFQNVEGSGGVDIDGTKWPAGLYSEVSQPFLKIKRGLSVPETDDLMKMIGFRRTLPMEYVNDELGIKIKDLHGMNAVMLEDENGKEFPYVIDSTIVPTQAKEEQPRVDLQGHVIVKNPEADFVAKPKILVNFLPASQRINLEDYADKPMFALPADRMGVGTKYVGPTDSKKKLSVEAQGGPEHMTLLNRGVWAFSNEGPASTFANRVDKLAEKHGTDSVLVAVTLQSPINHLKNPTGQLGYVEAMEQARDTKNLTQKQLDAQIKEMAGSIVASKGKDMDENVRAKWKKINSFTKFADAVRSKQLNFGDMEPFLTQMQRSKLPISGKELQSLGLLPQDIARDLSTDWIFDLPNDTVVGLFEVKKGTRPTQDNTHYSYPWSVAGKPIGFLKDIYHVKGLTTHPGIQKSTSLAWPLQRALPELDNLSKALADLKPIVTYR